MTHPASPPHDPPAATDAPRVYENVPPPAPPAVSYAVETVSHVELEQLTGGDQDADLESYLNKRARRGMTLVSVLSSANGVTFVWLAAPKTEHKK